MPFNTTDFPGLLIFDPVVFNDERGYFFESYNERIFKKHGIDVTFVQDNQARSVYGVIRGLHFQNPPKSQTKLIRTLDGSILDVVVDLRMGSPTYGKVFTVELSQKNRRQLLIPKGFAHGYSVLSETAEVFYKCDDFYDKDSEGGLAYDDSFLSIDWHIPIDKMLLSAKDLVHPVFANCKPHFVFEG